MQNVLMVFLGGGLGSIIRYGAAVMAGRTLGTAFPWGTLAVNLAGCLLAGIFIGAGERSGVIPHAARLFILVGFLGGLTTFSTYGLETWNAARAGDYWTMILSIAANNVAGIMLVGLGIFITRGS